MSPTIGVEFTLEETRDILKSVQLELETCQVTSLGYNNKVSFLTTVDGRQLVLKAGGRYWSRQKTEAEVAGLLFITRHLPALAVPKVVAFSSEPVRQGKIGKHEWILQERVPGVNLTIAWPTLDNNDKILMTRNLANAVTFIQGLGNQLLDNGLHATIGALSLTPPKEDKSGLGYNARTYRLYDHNSPMFISNPLNGPPPSSSYAEYVTTLYAQEVGRLEERLARDEMNFQANHFARLKEFGKIVGENALVQKITANPLWKPVFTHGDFKQQNILVHRTPERGLVFHILDWEWCGFFPPMMEWDQGLDDLVKFLAKEPGLDLDGIFLAALESGGVLTPQLGGELWVAARKMTRLIECMDPWWIDTSTPGVENSEEGKQIRQQLVEEMDQILDWFGAPVPVSQ